MQTIIILGTWYSKPVQYRPCRFRGQWNHGCFPRTIENTIIRNSHIDPKYGFGLTYTGRHAENDVELEIFLHMTVQEGFTEEQGIYVPKRSPRHRDKEYDETGFNMLIQIQREHFWYRGRHKLLLNVLKKEISRHFGKSNSLRAIDMGGGCGGWLEYIHAHDACMFQELALGDSSIRALSLAEPVVGSFAARYHIDLLDLTWSEEWDVVFLLDVLEHIPDHREVLRQVRRSMRPGGLLFVTTPALKFFWTYNDEMVHHQRRYRKQDFRALGEHADLELLRTEYFMFFLSPALLFSRILFRPSTSPTPKQLQDHLARTHRIPPKAINELLTKVCSIEASLVNFVDFPWGTSIIAVFKRCF